MAEKFEHKDNSGSLFRNSYKEADKHPDYKGTAKINGQLLDIAGWKNETKDGGSYLSLQFSEPYKKPEASPTLKRPQSDDFKSDIPF